MPKPGDLKAYEVLLESKNAVVGVLSHDNGKPCALIGIDSRRERAQKPTISGYPINSKELRRVANLCLFLAMVLDGNQEAAEATEVPANV